MINVGNKIYPLPEETVAKLETIKREIERPKWHQINKYMFTKFEISVELQIECDSWEERSRYVRARKFNSCLTADCQDEYEARKQLAAVIQAWFDDVTLVGQAGQLRYWKIFDE